MYKNVVFYLFDYLALLLKGSVFVFSLSFTGLAMEESTERDFLSGEQDEKNEEENSAEANLIYAIEKKEKQEEKTKVFKLDYGQFLSQKDFSTCYPKFYQRRAIKNLFNAYSLFKSSEKESIFKTIDILVLNKSILGRHANAVKSYIDDLVYVEPNFTPVNRGESGYESMCSNYRLISEQNNELIKDSSNWQWLKFDTLNSQKYLFADLPHSDRGYKSTVIELRDQDSVDAAREMSNLGYKTALVNFANRHIPGGGYRKGRLAQEEGICRRTTLFPALNKKLYPIQHNELIYSDNVVVFRDSWEKQFQVKNEGSTISVITVPAYNLNPNMRANDLSLSEQYLDGTKDKIRAQFRVAAAKGVDAIVLGAFGCGAFKGDPNIVAQIYKEVLNELEFIGIFELIIFAILDKESDNYKAFEQKMHAKPFIYGVQL